MMSRRNMLSRLEDHVQPSSSSQQPHEEEDIWYRKEILFKEHIQEVLEKWSKIDDEIWAKVIIFEKNRRIAKAYARAPVLTVNGSNDGFDGFRIGLCGFDNPFRDRKTEEIKLHIGHGVKIKMDESGNILIKRLSRGNVYVKDTTDGGDNALGKDIVDLPGWSLEPVKPFKLFDMKKFHSNVNQELRSAYPDRKKLEFQCLNAVTFVKDSADVLDCPVWILVINIVALEMLKSKVPPYYKTGGVKQRPRLLNPDEDPYSMIGNVNSYANFRLPVMPNGSNFGVPREPRELYFRSGGQSLMSRPRPTDRPPKLPPRDNMLPFKIPEPDYEDVDPKSVQTSDAKNKQKKKNSKEDKYENPYYCGLGVKIPNFILKAKSKDVKHH
ncbi:uncharacterized protein LOC108738798 [Agrilus planipennis]|uniref:Uncharacterized protein LOC108738798 n=1 Tax=Agrilus planipennis TaxID=224129 RepID=A0A1W4WVH9_AGRPL|nr:uncharacterized protein LOC108738798 [Agrilus planipennis]